MPSNHLILWHPLLLPPSIFPSIRVFPSESVLRIRWPKLWSFSFSINCSNEYSVLISFRIDWLDLLAIQETLKILQHHSSKASILRHSVFFMVQISHPCMTTGKTIALTRQTYVGKVMSLLLNMLSRLVTTFLPRSKCLLISALQWPTTVILESMKIKSLFPLFPHLKGLFPILKDCFPMCYLKGKQTSNFPCWTVSNLLKWSSEHGYFPPWWGIALS